MNLMEDNQTTFQERWNTGTTRTNNEEFEKQGYLKISNFCNAEELFDTPPKEKGHFNYWGKKLEDVIYTPVEPQVEGSTARVNHPKYRQLHSKIRIKLEEVLGRSLYNTYFYDRFYYPGQELKRHVDNNPCEISVTLHVSTNLLEKDKEWPIWIKTPDSYEDKKREKIVKPGENKSVVLLPGDAMIYKGCERPHWREPMPGLNYCKKMFGKEQEIYYHQIFFHYVLQDGLRAHFAWKSQ